MLHSSLSETTEQQFEDANGFSPSSVGIGQTLGKDLFGLCGEYRRSFGFKSHLLSQLALLEPSLP